MVEQAYLIYMYTKIDKISVQRFFKNSIHSFEDSVDLDHLTSIEVRQTARIRNQYNQVPHLSQDIKRESNKITINITNKTQEVSPFPSGDHKAAMNKPESMTNTRHK